MQARELLAQTELPLRTRVTAALAVLAPKGSTYEGSLTLEEAEYGILLVRPDRHYLERLAGFAGPSHVQDQDKRRQTALKSLRTSLTQATLAHVEQGEDARGAYFSITPASQGESNRKSRRQIKF
ncbi:MAG: hypothetical protein IT307_06145 [Chloroflexi bacterium]|nr:hypothetical protein [Chloroflexota bacterium]